MVLFGCGGHSRSIISTIREYSNEDIVLVDKNAVQNERILGCLVVREYQLKPNDRCMIAIGNNQKRKTIYEFLNGQQKIQWGMVCSPSAMVKEGVSIANGVFISANVYLGPQAAIGANTIINTSAVIEHEVKIGKHTHIAPNTTICGRSYIGNEVFCGASSTIIDNIFVCDQVTIGAGAVVTENIMEAGIYAGVPARKIKGRKKSC